jgi:aryl-alcohol dehydrogenase-like predicted oxidoreductase
MMRTRRLGGTTLEITPIGFGTWAIGGGDWEAGWGPQNERDAIAAIDRALEHGVNWIDTAAAYGLGRSEELVGQALRAGGRRPYVFTKCSMPWDDQRKIHRTLRAASVRRECEGSLRRLGIDVIDLYQIHWPIPDDELEEGWGAMARLQEEGKVRFIGVSNCDVAQMRRLQRIAPIASLQPPYSLLRRDVEHETLPFCAEHDIGVIVYSPMGSGLLTGAMTRERVAALPENDWRRRSARFQEPQLSRGLALAALLGEIGRRHGRAPGEAAIAWTLRHPAVTGAIVGARSAAQVDGVIGAATFRLTESEIAELETLALTLAAPPGAAPGATAPRSVP